MNAVHRAVRREVIHARGQELGLMITVTAEIGNICVSSEVFTSTTGFAATNCFGVKGMAVRGVSDGLIHLLKKESGGKGVRVVRDADGSSISIELHIIVENGVNIPTVCASIINEVKYVVEKMTGVKVSRVDVCVDSMIIS